MRSLPRLRSTAQPQNRSRGASKARTASKTRASACCTSTFVTESSLSGRFFACRTFCRFSHALLPACDYALWMGSRDTTSANGVPLKFRGLKVLAATMKLLSGLGLSRATEVVLTGFNQGGQAVLYHADREPLTAPVFRLVLLAVRSDLSEEQVALLWQASVLCSSRSPRH